MRLSRLELIGFKSFINRTVLQFPPEISAIVGPNGCGKSNIVDALRWVMGEQSARHLRGHLMEDVIFNGNETQPATGMAEVSLVFDNEDGRGPAEYSTFSEIVVTRKLFRSGESEYSINKIPCRLKDIIEFFLGTGVGNKAYSIMEQGRVEEMINAKPEEFRSLIEEAAGTSKYIGRKDGAERKLERTHQNLLRLNDIVREIERQIRSVELQAKKAERYNSIKGTLKEKELAWGALQRKGLTEEISEHEEKLRAVEDRSVQYLVSLRSQEAETEETKRALLDGEREIGSLQESVYQSKVQIHSEEQKTEFFNRDQTELMRATERAQFEIQEMQTKLQRLSAEIEGLKRVGEEFVQLSLFEGSQLTAKEEELDQLRVKMDRARSELEQEKGLLLEALNLESQWKNEQLSNERQREEVARELSRAQNEQTNVRLSLESWAQKQLDRGAVLEGCGERAKGIQAELTVATNNLQEWGGVKAGHEKEFENSKELLLDARSKLASLEALQKNYEGYHEGVRAIMFRQQKEAGFEGIHGLVADVIEAPETVEKALTAVLGDRLQYIIVQSHEDGLEAIEYLKRESAGRGSFIPRRLSSKGTKSLPLAEPEVVSPLLGLISVKDGFREIAEYLLGDVMVVRDLKAGLSLWGRNGFMNTLVTPEGEVIDPMGVITGGSLDNLQGNFLFQKRRVKELEIQVSELETQLKDKENDVAAMGQQMDLAEARKSELIEESHRLELERVQSEHELWQADQEVARLAERLKSLEHEQADLTSSRQRLDEKIREWEEKIERQRQERTSRERELEGKEEALSGMGEELIQIGSEVMESRVRTAALGEKKENTRVNLENRITLRNDLSEQVRSIESQVAKMKQKRARIEEQILLAEGSLKDGKTALEGVEQKLARERETYRDLSRRLAEMDESMKETRGLVQESQEEKNQLQLLLSEKRLSLQHLVDNLREKYASDLSQVAIPAGGPDEENFPDRLPDEIEELKGRIERMGDVNLTAIGEHEDLKSRFEFLSHQKEDLEKSVADLQRTIAKINRFCRLRFKESFDEINQRFQVIFTRLFRGGKARLVLTDENDYLRTGVDIVAQPPGKRLQSITLLSGGEKALTAISLLFSIFLTKPSPFCFLDEVDASLDDANVERFLEMVKEMSQTSQFVIITHNKRTMQAADVLYGITMADPGVSKVVSVQMN